MHNQSSSLNHQLLGQLPHPASLERYREGVQRALEGNAKRIARERLWTTLFWVFCVASAVAWLWFSPAMTNLPRAPFLACLFFFWGGVEVVKHYINACRVDLMKELKQLQLQVFDLEAVAAGPAKKENSRQT
jgi:hypothetical protein